MHRRSYGLIKSLVRSDGLDAEFEALRSGRKNPEFFRGFLTWLNVSSFVGHQQIPTTGLSKLLKCLAMSQGIQSCSLTETLIRPVLRSAERPSGMCLSFSQGTS